MEFEAYDVTNTESMIGLLGNPSLINLYLSFPEFV